MREIVDNDEIRSIRERFGEDRCCKISWNGDLLSVSINGEKYEGLTPEEAAKRFGTNYNFMQEFRALLNDEKAEEILRKTQSIKKEIIELFISLLKENNIFEGKISIEEIRLRLDKNMDAAYIVDEAYRKCCAGWYNLDSRNLYIRSDKIEELKEAIRDGKIEDIERDELGRICHECLHALSPEGLMFEQDGKEGIRRGRAINEGLVQFMTQQIVFNKWPFSSVYSTQVEEIETLLTLRGEKLIDAYLASDIRMLVSGYRECIGGPDYVQKSIEDKIYNYIFYTDVLLNLEDGDYLKNLELKETIEKEARKVEISLMNMLGIDMSKVTQNKVYLREGLEKNIIEQAMKKFVQEANDGYIEAFRVWDGSADYKIIKMIEKIIVEESKAQSKDGKIDLEYCATLMPQEYRLKIYLKQFLNENNNDLKVFFREFYNLMPTLERIQETGIWRYRKDQNKYFYIEEVLAEIMQEQSRDDMEKARFKSCIMFELGNFGYSLQEMISRIVDWEYYEVATGKFIVNSHNGEIIRVNEEQSTDIEGEETSYHIEKRILQKGEPYEYSDEEGKKQIFLTEKNKEGKYILKGYMKDEKGEQVEIDVGIGRDFCDDTTELDRAIMEKTSKVKTSGIKRMLDRIMNSIKIHTRRGKEAENNEGRGEA